MRCCPSRWHVRLLASYDRLSQSSKSAVRLLAVLGFLGIGVGAFAATETKACESEVALAAHEQSSSTDDVCMEPLTIVDAVYLTMATISTCGYGDFSPKSTGMRAFTCVYILGGATYVFMQLSAVFVNALHVFRGIVLRALERFDLTPKHFHEVLEDGRPATLSLAEPSSSRKAVDADSYRLRRLALSTAAKARWRRLRVLKHLVGSGRMSPTDPTGRSNAELRKRAATEVMKVRTVVGRISGRSRGLNGRGIDISGDGRVDFIAPPSSLVFWAQELLPVILLWLFLQLGSAGIFMACQNNVRPPSNDSGG